ncbi:MULTISPECIES: TonB-dependent receptor domain-containing protein [unclassified Massilia]|uniref:TonB-dependent receptor domain-containing protein n=1 Tax=unclassified Massilia TaxID=2609279 RepID=UPI001783ED05|nr:MULTISPECIES: TonB-dependent receptor [unclassified Massilia]MBD8533381.1 TonB-dependent receptor [Massilia sp. CFBP 13647]MBD8676779.1 TonB-dependent receptor [Massilia sp. CFBP 13721]
MHFHVSRQAAVSSLALAMAAPCALADTTPVDTVLVTAARIPQRAQDVIASTTIIHAEEIARSGAGSIADVLARQPGIEIARNGSAGASTSVFLRGANSNGVVVLLDGVRIGSSTAGSASWNAVPLDAIDRIEIVYGPLSTFYGADAIGGVIQIFTRKGEAGFAAVAAIGAGSEATRQARAQLSGASSGDHAVSYAIGAGYEESDGFSATKPGAFGFNPDDDGYRRSSASGRIAFALAPGHEIGGQFLNSRLRAQYDSGAGSYDVHNRQDLDTVAAFMSNQFLPNWRSTVQLARSNDKLGSFTSAAASGASQIDTRQDEFTWQNTLTLGRDTLQLLYGHRKESVESSATAALGRERITNSYAAAYALRRAGHLFDLSARQDRSHYGAKNTGAAGYGYEFTPGLRATASVGTSFRAPTFNELYYPGYGVPTNQPERGRNAELGLRYDRAGVQFDATLFRNRLRDMIVSATPCPDNRDGRTGSCAYNVASATLEGVSLAASTRLGALRLRGSLDWQDPRDNTTNKRLARRAREHGSFQADYTLGAFETGAEWQVSGERFDDAANLRRLGGYGLLNLYATWRIDADWSLLARVNNTLDKRYELARNYGTAERSWFAGLRYGIR